MYLNFLSFEPKSRLQRTWRFWGVAISTNEILMSLAKASSSSELGDGIYISSTTSVISIFNINIDQMLRYWNWYAPLHYAVSTHIRSRAFRSFSGSIQNLNWFSPLNSGKTNLICYDLIVGHILWVMFFKPTIGFQPIPPLMWSQDVFLLHHVSKNFNFQSASEFLFSDYILL
jgi:hypothetical protein